MRETILRIISETVTKYGKLFDFQSMLTDQQMIDILGHKIYEAIQTEMREATNELLSVRPSVDEDTEYLTSLCISALKTTLKDSPLRLSATELMEYDKVGVEVDSIGNAYIFKLEDAKEDGRQGV